MPMDKPNKNENTTIGDYGIEYRNKPHPSRRNTENDDGIIPLYWSHCKINANNAFRSKDGHFDQDAVNCANSLHNASRTVISLAQYFALFPVLGLNSTNTSELHFSWISKPMIYALFIIAFVILTDTLTIITATKHGLTYYNIVDLVFSANLTMIYMLFIQVARNWPSFANEWENMERSMLHYGYPRYLKKKFLLTTYASMILATTEHISSRATKMVDALPCSTGGWDLVRAYFVNAYMNIFSFVEYNLMVAVPVAIMTLIMSLAWNFVDLFIVVMSMAMAERYKQLNKLLKSVQGKVMPTSFWKNIRETYSRLANLTRLLDKILSPIILLSFANNLYFICLQLFNSLKPMESTWHAVYFVYSFACLVLRICAVSLHAAAIYEQSKEPKAVLFSVPSESYCIEVARLLTQVTSDELALTGCRFFSATRTLVLTVAGTIVTYEIVLVQFNSVSGDSKKNTTIICT